MGVDLAESCAEPVSNRSMTVSRQQSVTGLPASRWMIGGAVNRHARRIALEATNWSTTPVYDDGEARRRCRRRWSRRSRRCGVPGGIAEGLCDEELGQDAAHDVGLEVAKCPALEHDAGVAQQRPSRRRTPSAKKTGQYQPRRLASTVPHVLEKKTETCWSTWPRGLLADVVARAAYPPSRHACRCVAMGRALSLPHPGGRRPLATNPPNTLSTSTGRPA